MSGLALSHRFNLTHRPINYNGFVCGPDTVYERSEAYRALGVEVLHFNVQDKLFNEMILQGNLSLDGPRDHPLMLPDLP